MEPARIIVIGASNGAGGALEALVAGLPANLAAAVLVVRHLPPHGFNLLADLLDAAGPLPASLARNGVALEAGRVVVAPVDQHLLVEADCIRLSRGPHENRTRPAIDPLFRSAALSHGPRAIGVLLSGLLDDGSAGLMALKQSGGVAVVQDPADARCPDMPRNALSYVDADHCIPAAEMGPLLARLVAAEPPPPPADLNPQLVTGWQREIDILRFGSGDLPPPKGYDEAVPASCPACGGPLWQMEDGMPRYRCHTGHGYTSRHLVAGLGAAAEESLWAALRVLEERARMLHRIAKHDAERGFEGSERAYRERADEAERHVASLRRLLNAEMPKARGR